MDVLCQAKSGMGKTAVFVLACLQQLDLSQKHDGPQVLVLCHTRELAFQIKNEFTRFCKFLAVETAVLYGGVAISLNKASLAEKPPIVVGTPGRIKQLVRDKVLNLSSVKHFVLDECDKLLDSLCTSY